MSESDSDSGGVPLGRIGFRRSVSIPGVEVLDVVESDHRFNWYHTLFGVGLPTTWVGDVRYRGTERTIEPGMALYVSPGELTTMPRVRQAGTYNAVMFERDVFAGHAAEHAISAGSLEWRMLSGPVSRVLGQRFAQFTALLDPIHRPMELQASMVELFAALVGELLATKRQMVPKRSSFAAQRMRELLHSSEGPELDLDGLASRVGLTRFQALRAFKRRYGLPPHAYQLCTQVAAAMPLLRNGESLSHVALTCGFADQSHFGRMFKRVFGLTPGRYAKGERARSTALAVPEQRI